MSFTCEPGGGEVVANSDEDDDDGSFVTPYGASANKKGWCSLVPGTTPDMFGPLFFLPAIAFIITRLRFLLHRKK